MSWIQEPEVDALEPMGSVCSCIGATCKGRCTPYAVCLMYLGNKCNLSAGEKQKIAIVRTIIKGGCVLIFDEPTSALDTLTRDRFLAYLQNHKKNKMVIIVSHDITLLQQLDEVVRMEGTTFE